MNGRRTLRALDRGQVPVYVTTQLAQLPLEREDLIIDVHGTIARSVLELVDLALELRDRLLEIHGRCCSRHSDLLCP
jgi:hypothetical protein